METNVTIAVAATAARTPRTRRTGCLRGRFGVGADGNDAVGGAGSPTAGGSLGSDRSRAGSVNDHQDAARLNRGAGGHGDVLYATGLR